MSNIDKQALLSTDKHANQHMLSRLIVEANSAEIRDIAEAVEQYTDRLIAALEDAEKRIAELEARDINIKRQAQALFEAIANPNDCYIPAYVRCLREALNGNSTGIGVKGD